MAQRNALTEAQNYVQRLKDQAGSFAGGIGNALQAATNYFNPNIGVVQPPRQIASPVPYRQPVQIPQVRSFWTDLPQVSPKFNSPMLGDVAANFAPRIPDQTRNLPVVGGAYDLAGNIARETLNAPQNLISAGLQMQKQSAQQALAPTGLTKAPTPQEYLATGGKFGNAALNLLPFTGLGEVMPAFKIAGEIGPVKSAIAGGLTGAAYGGVQSFLRGLEDNKNVSIGDQLRKAGLAGVQGAVTGGLVGGAVGAGGSILSRLYTRKPTEIFNDIKALRPNWPDSKIKSAGADFIEKHTLGTNYVQDSVTGQLKGSRKVSPTFIQDHYLTDAEINALRTKYGLSVSPPGMTTKVLSPEEGAALRKISGNSPQQGVGGGGITKIKDSSGKVVGEMDAVINRFNPESITVNRVMINPKNQGQGLGTKTIQQLFNDNPGINRIDGHSTAEARSFWEKLGAKFSNSADNTAFTLSRDDVFKSTPPPLNQGATDPTQLLPQGEPKLAKSSRQVLQKLETALKEPPQLPELTSGNAPLGDIVTPKNQPFYNTSKMGVSPQAKDLTQQTINSPEVTSKIAEVGGPKLTFKEVQAGAKVSPELNKTFTRETTQALGEQSLALRQKIADLAQTGLNPDQFQEALVKDKAFGMYVARLLGQRRIVSNPADKTIFNKIIGAILKEGHDPEEVAKAAKNINFDNAEEATKFYRTYIKSKPKDWVDAVRYSSMLSSLNTQINNASSNFQGTGLVAPIEKTVTGGIDFLRATGAKVLGKNYDRQYFPGEGVKYAQGYWSNVGNAAHHFADVMTGKSLSNMQEIHNIPLSTGGMMRKAENILTFPGKLLQASDEFFQTMTQAGSKKALEYKIAKGGKVVGNIDTAAYLEGRKRLFNAEFNLPEEGHFLKALEFIPQKVAEARASKNPVISNVAKYTFPFVRIPSNLLKASVEYSPLGLATLPGATNKTEQLAKFAMGTSIGLGTAMLVSTDRLSWSEPADPTKKAAFRAAGMQPYAVKIGNNWVSYAKMHPVIGFNLALVAALRDAEQNKILDENQVNTVLNGLAQWTQYYADASYVKNIGDMVSSAKGDINAPARIAGNYVQQLIPYRALLGWVTRIVDPVQRQADPKGNILQKQLQQIAAQIPGLSSTVPARVDSNGQPIPNQNNLVNAFSPARVTTEVPQAKKEYDKLLMESRQNKLESDLRSKVLSSGEVIQNGDKLFFRTKDGKGKDVARTIDLSQPLPGGLGPQYGIESRASKVLQYSQFFDPNSSITKDKAVEILKQLKADPTTSYKLAQRSIVTTQQNAARTAYKIKNALVKMDPSRREEFMQQLDDKGILTPEVRAVLGGK